MAGGGAMYRHINRKNRTYQHRRTRKARSPSPPSYRTLPQWQRLLDHRRTTPFRFERKTPLLIGTIILWVLFIIHLVIVGIAPAQEFGWRIIVVDDESGIWKTRGFFSMILALNILSTTIVFISDHVRRSILAPTTTDDANDIVIMGIGYQSFRNWRSLNWKKRLLFVVLGLTSLPIHLLYNSMVLKVQSSYDAYEILASERFLAGAAVNISNQIPTQFQDQSGAPVAYNTAFPTEWPAVPALQTVLQSVQKTPSIWDNLTEQECRDRYSSDVFHLFRTVIMITDWDQSNDSVLALGALPGQPQGEITDRFMALCPTAWIENTNGSSRPNTTPYISIYPAWLADECYDAAGPSLNCSIPYNVTVEVPGKLPTPADMASSVDLCYFYRQEAVNTSQTVDLQANNQLWNRTEAVRLKYCLSEPLTDHTTQFVLIPRIAQLMCLLLGIKAVIAVTAYFMISGTPILEAESYGIQEDNEDKSLTGTMVLWLIINTVIFVWLNVVWDSGRSTFGAGVVPASSTDQYWLAGILVWQNILHLLLNMRMLMESNAFDAYVGGRRWAGTGLLIAYTVGLHQLISSWLSIRIVQRHGLESLAQTAVPHPIAFQDTFSSPNALYSTASDDQPLPMFFGFFGIVFGSMVLFWLIFAFADRYLQKCFIPLCCCCSGSGSEDEKDEEEAIALNDTTPQAASGKQTSDKDISGLPEIVVQQWPLDDEDSESVPDTGYTYTSGISITRTARPP